VKGFGKQMNIPLRGDLQFAVNDQEGGGRLSQTEKRGSNVQFSNAEGGGGGVKTE